MLLKLKPKPDTALEELLLCDEIHIDKLDNPRIVPLFGPNGIGKSSVLEGIMDSSARLVSQKYNSIYEKCNSRYGTFEIVRTDAQMDMLSYRNLKDNCARRQSRNEAEQFNPYFLIDRLNARGISEGQSIIYSLMDLLTIIGTTKDARYPEDGHEYLVILDEIDSGLSIDNLDFVMRKLKRTSMFRKDVQVVFSFNSPYVVNYFPQVMSLYTGEPCRLYTPKDMLDEIKIHEKEFRKKRYYSNGRPRIFN